MCRNASVLWISPPSEAKIFEESFREDPTLFGCCVGV